MKQILIAVDQLANAIIGGWADETLSARSWRLGRKPGRWSYARIFIDALFFFEDQHCFSSYVSEYERLQIAPEYRKRMFTTDP